MAGVIVTYSSMARLARQRCSRPQVSKVRLATTRPPRIASVWGDVRGRDTPSIGRSMSGVGSGRAVGMATGESGCAPARICAGVARPSCSRSGMPPEGGTTAAVTTACGVAGNVCARLSKGKASVRKRALIRTEFATVRPRTTSRMAGCDGESGCFIRCGAAFSYELSSGHDRNRL